MTIKSSITAVAALALVLTSGAAAAAQITVAAAADLKFAMSAVTAAFKATHPSDSVDVSYGSSGNFATQIRQDAPFDVFFSADRDYTQQLADAGYAASPVTSYAVGKLVIWSAKVDASHLSLVDLTAPRFTHIAIANPAHAPYGKRAEEALRAAGVWDAIQPKLVYGENIAQTAEFALGGSADVGLIAQSLAMDPTLAAKGGYAPVPPSLYTPLDQAFIVTRRAGANPLAKAFTSFVQSSEGRAILRRYGFSPPEETTTPGH